MKLFQSTLGIDPSGGRLAIVAFRGGLGRRDFPFPPVCHEPKSEKESVRLEEAEGFLGEYVARHGLVGAEAALVLPADRVHMARAVFPPLKERDLREAVGLELERLFPVPLAGLRFAFRRLPGPAEEGKVRLVVAAAASEFIGRWEEVVARAGLSLSAAVPAAWAVGDAVSRIVSAFPGDPGRPAVVLRGLGGAVECTAFAGGEPFFSAGRACAPEAAPSEGLSLALSALADAPPSSVEEPVELFAPAGWYPARGREFEEGGVRFRGNDALGGAASSFDRFPFLGAIGAASRGGRVYLLSPPRDGSVSGMSRAFLGISAAAALALGIAWPASIAWNARAELRRLDARVAELLPAARQHEETLSDLDDVQERIATIRGEAEASGETLRILRELTERLPNGTWLLSLRMEGRKVEMEGLSPSASEIFPVLTRDGRFKSVEFGAPITRQPDNAERFKIRGEYVPPPGQESPVPGADR